MDTFLKQSFILFILKCTLSCATAGTGKPPHLDFLIFRM